MIERRGGVADGAALGGFAGEALRGAELAGPPDEELDDAAFSRFEHPNGATTTPSVMAARSCPRLRVIARR
jgi:hypothetical protein